MLEDAITRFSFILDTVPNLLSSMSEEQYSSKPLENKWSKKEILGHLIDSATNNHQRFVRGQFEFVPEINYNQNKWNAFSYYQEIESQQLIAFWTVYNKQLLELMKRIPTEYLSREIKIGENIYTLEFLIRDYVAHLEYHLKQIVDY